MWNCIGSLATRISLICINLTSYPKMCVFHDASCSMIMNIRPPTEPCTSSSLPVIGAGQGYVCNERWIEQYSRLFGVSLFYSSFRKLIQIGVRHIRKQNNFLFPTLQNSVKFSLSVAKNRDMRVMTGQPHLISYGVVTLLPLL